MTRVRYECVSKNSKVTAVVDTLAQARAFVEKNGGKYKAIFNENPQAKNLDEFWKM